MNHLKTYESFSYDGDNQYPQKPLIGNPMFNMATAIRGGNIMGIKSLLDNGANIEDKINGRTPLLFAFFEDGGDEIIEFLINNGANIEAKDKEGLTALMLSVLQQRVGLALFLISNGADVNTIENLHNRTPLLLACYYDDEEMVEILTESGADINAKDKYGWTPLILSSSEDNMGNVEYLIRAGADMNIKDNEGKTFIDYIEKDYQLDIIKDAVKKYQPENIRLLDNK